MCTGLQKDKQNFTWIHEHIFKEKLWRPFEKY